MMNLNFGSRRSDIPCRNGTPEQRNLSISATFAEGLSTSQMWRRRFRQCPRSAFLDRRWRGSRLHDAPYESRYDDSQRDEGRNCGEGHGNSDLPLKIDSTSARLDV